MADYFLSKLPANHAIRTLSRAAAAAMVRGSPLAVAAPDNTLAGARRQCAALAWANSDVCTIGTVEKLAAVDRAFLLSLFGLALGGTAKAQARVIDAHVRTNRPAPASGGAGAVAAAPPAAGGPVAAAALAAGGPVAAAPAAGAPAAASPLDAGGGASASGLADVLLDSAQLVALHALDKPAILSLLHAAGVPCDPISDSIHTLRDKCAAAAWAGERLRFTGDVNALPGPAQSRLADAFGIPACWRAEARDQALESLLQVCRDSSWARDPLASRGLIHADRSAIFRVAEELQEAQSRQRSLAQPRAGEFLSAADQASITTRLALTGHSLEDFEFARGQWQIRAQGGHGGAGPSLPVPVLPSYPPVDAAAQSELENQTRTLYVDPYSLLTPAEVKDQANRSKAMSGRKRAAAYPGDTEVDAAAASLNPFTEWPHEQRLRFEQSYSYSLCGRMLRNAMLWCNRHFTDNVAQITWQTQQATTSRLYTQFQTAVQSHKHDQALLVVQQAISEAKLQMASIAATAKRNATSFPRSELLQHVATRRAVQLRDLPAFLGDISQRVTDASEKAAPSQSAQGQSSTVLALASWIDFMEGWLAPADSSLISSASIRLVATAEPTARAAPGHTPPAPETLRPGPGAGGVSTRAAARSAGTRGAGGAGPSSVAPNSSMGRLPLRQVCQFRRHIPCSPEIVGGTLGVPGAPTCNRCHQGRHYHGECPMEWGKVGRALPGFGDDGSRLDKAWRDNEPVKSVVTAWVAFLQDKSNFNHRFPEPSGVTGAPSLADFQARVSEAPGKK